MNKKLLSLALTLSLIGSSFAATTEEEKQDLLKAIIKTAAHDAEKKFPDRGKKDIAVAALIGAFGCTASACAATRFFNNAFHEVVQNDTAKSLFAATGSSALGFVGYEKVQQMRTNKKITQKEHLITERVLAHYAEHPEDTPAILPTEFTPFIEHYRTNKSILQNDNTEKIIAVIAILSVLACYYSNPVLAAATQAAEQAYPTRGLPTAAVAGTLAGLLTTGITVVNSMLIDPASTNKAVYTAITTTLCGAGVFALYEGLKQRRETAKKRMVIEHLVKHYAEHQDELNDGQMTVFAELITEFNEKKSLNIKNPEDVLAQLTAVL